MKLRIPYRWIIVFDMLVQVTYKYKNWMFLRQNKFYVTTFISLIADDFIFGITRLLAFGQKDVNAKERRKCLRMLSIAMFEPCRIWVYENS
jgi:hypothetical protein